MSKKDGRDLTWFLKNCPGVTGELARYVNSKLKTDQPGIALSSALPFMGTVRSQRVCTYSGIAPNIYTLALAPSGSGKTSVQRIITDLCVACDFQDLLMGRPGSDSGILTRLQYNPCQLLIWDEFGLTLKEMANSQSSYRVGIITTMMDLYSAANSTYIGRELKGEDRIDIRNPHLSIAGASTPGVFYDSLTRDFIDRGFIPRILVFEESRNLKFKDASSAPIPEDIIRELIELRAGIYCETGGDLKKGIVEECFNLKLDDILLSVIEGQFQAKLKKAKTEIESALWARAFEHTMKLCLIFSSIDGECNSDDLEYSYSLVETLIESLIERCEDIQDSQHEKRQVSRFDKFRDIIPIGGEMTLSEVTIKSQRNFSKKEREERIAGLLETGEWIENHKQNPNAKKITTVYYRPSKLDKENSKLHNFALNSQQMRSYETDLTIEDASIFHE